MGDCTRARAIAASSVAVADVVCIVSASKGGLSSDEMTVVAKAGLSC